MELSSPESIAESLIAGARETLAKPRGSLGALRPPVPDRRRSCHCGKCHQCIENARWERIFAEKFADRDYYKRHGGQHSSPLASL
jgi:hypothetical protein